MAVGVGVICRQVAGEQEEKWDPDLQLVGLYRSSWGKFTVTWKRILHDVSGLS